MIKRKRIVCLMVCLFVIVVLPLLNLQNNPVYAATPGWLSGWQYRKSHVINAATGAGTNYQIPIKLYYNASAFGYEERDGQFKASDYDSLGNLYIQGREPSVPDKLYKSTDGGKTFSVVYTLDAGGRFTRKVLFIDSQDRIFISAEGFTSGDPSRLLRSTDGGQTFSQVLAAPVWDMDEDASGNLYAGRYGDAAKVYKSTDGGANWMDISSPAWTSENTDHIHRVRIDPSTGWLYVTIGDKTGTGALSGLWRSKLKNGADWVRVYGDSPTTPKSLFIGIVFKDSYIYVGDDNEADNGRIYRFQDNGTSNLRVVSDLDLVLNITDGVNRAAFYLEKDDTGRIWATFYPYPSPADGRIYTSEDGISWTYRGTFTRTFSFSEVTAYNYMEAGVRHFRGKEESIFAIEGGHLRATFNIHATSLNGHSRTDFGDVRFTSSDGTTLLDYWIEEKVDGDYAVFWVEVSEDLGSDRTIYVYYGKSDATTTSNGNNTFPFFDDFSGDLSKWTSLLGTWKIVGGELRSTATDDSLIRSATYQVANARVRTKLRLDTASDYWSPVLRFQDANNFYQTGASRASGYQYHRQYKCVGGSFTKIGTEVIFNPAQTSHTSTSLAYGSSLKAYQDDAYKIEATDSQFSSGYIALKFCSTGQNGIGYVDWVFVGKYVSPEPAHGAWGSEEISNYVVIDQTFVSDERADVGSIQTIGFHAKWGNNGSDVVGGNIYVNGTNYVTNSTGWINVRAAARREAPDNFTIIALPDTQFYSESHPEIFDSQTQWVVNNAQSMNTVFVTHEGDIVNDYSSLSQWNSANNSIGKLDAGNVSYGVLPGNHDGSPLYLSNFNKFFNSSRFNGKSWYGGAYQSENANNFELFHGGQNDYLIFHFQYDPSDQVLTWANSTLQNYPNRRVIVTTHSYLNVDGTRTDIGNRIWQNFVAPHADQIFLVLCGHNHAETQRIDIINSHTVYQIMANYQNRTNGGNGWLRILEFHPVEDKIYVRTYSPYLNNYETDADSQFTLDYDMTWAASPIVEKVKWIVTGVNCSGITIYTQTAQIPSIVWDRIKIIDEDVTKGSVTLGETVTIWFKAIYEYDNTVFTNANGILYLNGSAMTWSATNTRWEYTYTATAIETATFTISGVYDNSQGLTTINDTVGSQTITVWSTPFAIISNSTISELTFNSTSKTLTFTLNGSTGTTGYTNLTIAKTLIEDISGLTIYLDQEPINYTTASTNYFWLIHFTYNHSTHKVVIILNSPYSAQFIETPLGTAAVFSVITLAILATTLLVWIRRTRRQHQN